MIAANRSILFLMGEVLFFALQQVLDMDMRENAFVLSGIR